MRILVACEESQAVTIALRARGHEAVSCDIQPESGGHPEWHIEGDALGAAYSGAYDAMVAFPPCTHLSSSGARWWPAKVADGRQDEAVAFFMALWAAPIARVVIENPVGLMSSRFRKPDQIVQPWMFGDPYQKTTCLWYRGVQPLVPDDVVEGREQACWKMGPSPERAKLRSKTYPGIARAIAEQMFAPGEATT
jgi:site-specific DNA-cytosine methylase